VALEEAGATQFSFDAATGGVEQIRAAAAVLDARAAQP
jgi:hypothetical protein